MDRGNAESAGFAVGVIEEANQPEHRDDPPLVASVGWRHGSDLIVFSRGRERVLWDYQTLRRYHERSTETYGPDSTLLIPEPAKPRARATMNPNNAMTFPAPVPEIPAANVDQAAAYYVNTLGFTFDWGDDQGGIAGISRGNCRLFITNRSFRESYGNIGPILFWLNLDSKVEVDELFAEWKAAQAKIVSEPEDKPWKLREFMAADLDGNLIRVFYDFRGDMQEDHTSRIAG